MAIVCRPACSRGITRCATLPRKTGTNWPSTRAVQPGIQVSPTTSRPGAWVVTFKVGRSGSTEDHSAAVKVWRGSFATEASGSWSMTTDSWGSSSRKSERMTGGGSVTTVARGTT